ncbi:LRR domain containing protein [Parasponia andersonii]|uniref:LRR domain containing protein n=1 Tax=Parasponia andersonii TaxID=3476 RepID=A0A2P5BFK6_PARAD|nr:LRR domain containing protein [Parasponia andersonii]
MLSKSTGKLQNLQTLDLRHTAVFELPVKIEKLQSLQHLLVDTYNLKLEFNFDSIHGLRIQGRVGCLQDLQTLRTVEAQNKSLIRELKKLRHLRSLGISKLTTELGRSLCTSTEKMKDVSFLVLFSMNSDEVLDLQSISSCPKFLQVLILKCRLRKLPYWIVELQNLRRLSLYFSRLIDDPLKCFHGLPNLEILWLNQAYDGEKLHFKEGGFWKLKELELRKLNGLKVVNIDRRSLPLLEVLMIRPTPLLEAWSFEIRHLKNLKSFHIFEIPREFVLGMQPNGDPNYWKIMHVKSVRC